MSSAPDPADATSHAVATEFVTEAFETDVPEGIVERLAAAVDEAVRELRDRVRSDDRLEALLRSEPGGRVLKEADSVERSDPEPLTQALVIEPLFEVLGYESLDPEAGDLSDTRGKQADYSVSLRDHPDVDSNRLLVEAEPLNKPLHQERHGLGQVRDWLEKDKFEADFGIATDGLRWVLIKYDRDTYSFDTIAEVSLQPVFLAAFESLTGRGITLTEWLDEGGDEDLDALLADFVRSFAYENFLSIAGEARDVIKQRKETITDEFYEDYVCLVFGVREDDEDGEAAARSLVGEGVVAPEAADGDDVRLFAVELMNRLIFIEFLQDKGIVEENLLGELREAHERGVHPQSLYSTFVEPLFFGVLDERPGARPPRVKNQELYAGVPYLNGGLFRPTTYETDDGQRFEDTDFDVRDSVLESIIDLLERYDFSADGGPTDLDPSVLGNVFEKTINYITGDQGDQKKELGAYYTPDEITRFCAEETVRPALLERFGDRLVAEWGYTEAMVEEYDDVHALIDALPPNTDLVEDLLGIVDEFRALDPACGSGHFLTSVQGELVGIRKALYALHEDDPQDWELHKRTVVQNVYGVDIVEPAVEIAKLRLWLSIIAEVEPGELEEYDEEDLALPNVVFNVRQGNSLIGFTDLMETSSDGDQAQLSAWGPDSVRSKYGDIIDLVDKHRETSRTEEASEYLEKAESLLEDYRDDLDEKVLTEFRDAGIEGATLEQVRSYDPFHWVLEFAIVYADGGFDVIVGNPPWDRIKASRDEFFSRHDERFRSRSNDEKDRVVESILEDDQLSNKWEKYKQRVETQTQYFNQSSAYKLQQPTVAGKGVGDKNDLATLFFERVFDLAGEDGVVAKVLPGVIFTGSAGKDLRVKLLTQSTVQKIVGFENHGIFQGLHRQYKFGIVVFRNSGETESLTGIFNQTDIEVLENFDDIAVSIPQRVLIEYSPEARIFPAITSQQEVDVLSKMFNHPSLAVEMSDGWNVDPLKEELNSYRDKDRFLESPEGADYPVYGGSNIYQFSHDDSIFDDIEPPSIWSVDEHTPEQSAKYRTREKRFNSGELKRAIYEQFDGSRTSKSMKGFVDDLLEEERGDPLSMEDVKPDYTEYRIGFRDVTNSTNERTLISAVLPPGIVCEDTLQTLRPFKINVERDCLSQYPLHCAYDRNFTDEELFTALGLLNSLPFDYLISTKVDTHIAKYKLEESQIPRLTEGDPWFDYISTRAARLNCYGEAFAEMRERLGGIDPATDPGERKRLQAEIDAAAFHAYGLDREETAFVLEDFHRVRDPRLMTEEYFELVLETYDDLDGGLR